MQGAPLRGVVNEIDDLFGSLQLGSGKIGKFEGESRELLGDFEDISDFDGMVNTLLKMEGIAADRDERVQQPFPTFFGWLEQFNNK
jgi:hypothetical protein